MAPEMMPLSVLILEDRPADAELVAEELRRAGFEPDWQRVDTERDYLAALDAGPAVILADYNMPELDPHWALARLRERGLDIPFVIVSGAASEEAAVECVKQGAADYLSKDRLGRLGPAVTRALRDRALREKKRQADAEIRRQRDALLQREKLVTMGSLLAGVAHELNNPLSVVLSQAALLRQQVGEGPLAERVDKLARAADRCARIVKNFLALARQRPAERQPVSLNGVVQEVVELLAHSLRMDNVEIALDLAQDMPAIWADPHQLQQVVVNLATNAQHAMHAAPPPRRLTFTSRSDRAERRISLEIADSGPGVPPALRDRIFEPFFTTKLEGQGTGLGLPLCQGIVEEHRGTLRLVDGSGGGAVFRIELPVKEIPAIAPTPAAPAAEPAAGRERILIVDDEPEIAEILGILLSDEGYQVDVAGDGLLALERLEARTYDLILSDLRMPRLDGSGLYREVARHHPALLRRFVFMTVDALSPETRALIEESGTPSLVKPFAMDDVRRIVRRVLAQSRAEP